MPTSVKGGHLHDSKVLVGERHVGGRRMVVTACSECGEVHEERPARTGEGHALDPLADVI